jgi:hypothetical protein
MLLASENFRAPMGVYTLKFHRINQKVTKKMNWAVLIIIAVKLVVPCLYKAVWKWGIVCHHRWGAAKKYMA